ncbi:MAG: hypothetical protein QOD32_1153 [Pyrinomonadaceae bacterium]|jgi:hypothetical protein|nr:hypothetical protein [Pyrinomonadaceae bacterium]
MSSKKADEESVKVANSTEAINQLLRAVDCPTGLHAFLRCLIGYADGRIDVSVFDAELGARINFNRSEDASAKWVYRNRRKLLDWQKENHIQLVECKSGFVNKDGKPIPSRYYIHLTNYINRILEEAQNDKSRWNKIPHVAIEFATRRILNEIYAEPREFKPRESKAKDIAKDISKRLNLANSSIEAVLNMGQEHHDKITDEHIELWEQLKWIINYANYLFEDEDSLEGEDDDYYKRINKDD